MSRVFCIPGIIFLVCALVLSFLTSISLPYLPALDIARTHFGNGALEAGQQSMTQLRFGVWAPCYYDQADKRTCYQRGHGYEVTVNNQDKTETVTIGSSWTRGLAVHPVATAVTFVAFLLSFSTHTTVTLFSSLISFLAAFLTLIAFAIDIALFAFVKHQMKKLAGEPGPNEFVPRTVPGPGFWLTLASFILLLLGGCTVCFGRRRDRLSTATSIPMKQTTPKKPFWSRFRKN